MSRSKDFSGIQENVEAYADRVAPVDETLVKKKVNSLCPELPKNFQPIPTQPLSEDLSNFAQAFKPVLFMRRLYYPIYLDMELLGDRIYSGEEISVDELNEKYLYVQQETEDGLMPFNAVYTDSRLFAPNTTYKAGDVVDVLRFFLFDPHSAGIAINPPSRAVDVAPDQVTFMSKDSIASLIGMLECNGEEPPPGTPFHELVLRADLAENPFQVIYLWNRSYRTPRPEDDCTLVYLEKLKACWRLNYPGAREKAARGLEWLMDYSGSTAETDEVWNEWRLVLSVH
jgi:hypothetical protein